MTQYNPSLKISRLIAVKNAKPIYDENFHDGINILSGCNGGGKTSVIQLLVFGLGYEISNWKNEAGSCDYICLEIEANGIIFTLKRYIKNKKEKQPIYFCYMSFEHAISLGEEGWDKFPYSSSDGSVSFSQKLFNILDIPNAKIDLNNNNLTMHQILRVIYGDQSNASGNLFNIEKFDSAFKRESIGNYLLGLYDDELYSDRVSLVKKDKELNKLISKVSGITSILSNTKLIDSIDTIENKKNKFLNEIKFLNEDILDKKVDALGDYRDEKELSEKVAVTFVKNKTNLYECESKLNELQYDLNDSKDFIDELKNKKASIKDALRVNEVIYNFPFDFCPCCQSKLPVFNEKSCRLCGSQNTEDKSKENLLRMLTEIELQIAESEKNFFRKEEKLKDIKKNRNLLRRKFREATIRAASAISSLNSKNEIYITEAHQKIGALEEQIKILDSMSELHSMLNNSINERDILQIEVNVLKDRISKKENIYRIREPEVKACIEKNLISILKKDIGSEDEFALAEKIEFDFASNHLSVNGKSSFSESGMIYLYNAFKLSLLLTSLEKSYLRIPRFIILDGIENGGMEDIRSKNFQKAIHDLLCDSKIKYQIIFATKSIENILDNNTYLVGQTLTKKNKSLGISTL